MAVLSRTMDRADLDDPRAQEICASLNALVVELRARGLQASSWYGGLTTAYHLPDWERANRGPGYEALPGAADDSRFPWFLYWEIAWLAMHNDFRPGQRVLDLGGSSSLHSFWLASHGVEVVTVDLQEELVANADAVAAATGWQLSNHVMDMRALKLDGPFDHVTSVCVFEHIPVTDRVEVTAGIRELLAAGGSFSITFDYANPSRLARIGSPRDVREQFVEPAGLRARGAPEFVDNGLRYLVHPAHQPRAAEKGWSEISIELGQFEPGEPGAAADSGEYTFGALFLERDQSASGAS